MDGNQNHAVQTAQTVQTVSPAGLSAPGGHYSHATVANGFVFVSGQLPVTPDGQKLSAAPFDEQARQVLANVEAALVAAGSGIAGLVQVRVYVDSIENWPAFNAIYAAWAGNARPARAIVPTGPLHFGLKVEVEATAVVLPAA
ncbi:RidA family protein [Cupriavidus basilensis]|jgi:reactive intermediate/imine deaminase|uniref:RidA family protein n=1 Tax=Cupriavidus basilensis TaxID=68895 RepID=UPI000448BDCB|nr:RidA family protein [Cupriavidus basilensis]MDF3887382.1 RidA family protein [Cupriavidus basilensis]